MGGWGGSAIIPNKIPALTLRKAERQEQGSLGGKIRRKGWASPE
jgi:hypothetical protein